MASKWMVLTGLVLVGRVASFSTTAGSNEIADPNFSRLIANALDWAQRD